MDSCTLRKERALSRPDRPHPSTWLAKAGFRHDSASGGVAPPIPLSTTYVRDEAYELPEGRLYLRDDNPLFEQAEDILASLEGAAGAAVFASGLVKPGSVDEEDTTGFHFLPCLHR